MQWEHGTCTCWTHAMLIVKSFDSKDNAFIIKGWYQPRMWWKHGSLIEYICLLQYIVL